MTRRVVREVDKVHWVAEQNIHCSQHRIFPCNIGSDAFFVLARIQPDNFCTWSEHDRVSKVSMLVHFSRLPLPMSISIFQNYIPDAKREAISESSKYSRLIVSLPHRLTYLHCVICCDDYCYTDTKSSLVVLISLNTTHSEARLPSSANK